MDLDESDFNEDDVQMISALDKMYPIEMIENSSVVEIDNQKRTAYQSGVCRHRRRRVADH
ncbi:MAG: hypothetical protein NC427_10880 [Ruminococcus flavefaciens]|nr:hypothetical protein [Ruminococcus flavefaciens]